MDERNDAGLVADATMLFTIPNWNNCAHASHMDGFHWMSHVNIQFCYSRAKCQRAGARLAWPRILATCVVWRHVAWKNCTKARRLKNANVLGKSSCCKMHQQPAPETTNWCVGGAIVSSPNRIWRIKLHIAKECHEWMDLWMDERNDASSVADATLLFTNPNCNNCANASHMYGSHWMPNVDFQCCYSRAQCQRAGARFALFLL